MLFANRPKARLEAGLVSLFRRLTREDPLC
jgi:hypothetical protein